MNLMFLLMYMRKEGFNLSNTNHLCILIISVSFLLSSDLMSSLAGSGQAERHEQQQKALAAAYMSHSQYQAAALTSHSLTHEQMQAMPLAHM